MPISIKRTSRADGLEQRNAETDTKYSEGSKCQWFDQSFDPIACESDDATVTASAAATDTTGVRGKKRHRHASDDTHHHLHVGNCGKNELWGREIPGKFPIGFPRLQIVSAICELHSETMTATRCTRCLKRGDRGSEFIMRPNLEEFFFLLLHSFVYYSPLACVNVFSGLGV